MTLLLWIIPAAYVVLLLVCALRRRWWALLASGVLGAAMVTAELWASGRTPARASLAWILVAPSIIAAAGLLGLAYGAWYRSPRWALRIFAWIALTAGLSLPVVTIGQVVAYESSVAVETERMLADTRKKADWWNLHDSARRVHRGPRPDDPDVQLRAHLGDRDAVLAMLPRANLSAGLLDSLAESPDRDIAVAAVKNVGASRSTLERAWADPVRRPMFYEALAGNSNTPPAILRAMRGSPARPFTAWDFWMAGNPGAPADLLDEIARTASTARVARSLLDNVSLTCRQARLVAAGPAATPDSSGRALAGEAAERVAARCRGADALTAGSPAGQAPE